MGSWGRTTRPRGTACLALGASAGVALVLFVGIARGAPTFSPASDVTTEAQGPQTSVTFSAPTATDANGAPLNVTCAPSSGSPFPVGTTPVQCSATDPNDGVPGSASFNVIVTDTTPPTVTAPSGVITVPATGTSTPYDFSGQVGANDLVDGPVSVVCVPGPGSSFPLGQTPVSCHATDSHGNQATAPSFTVLVVDNTPPQITGTPSNISIEATGPTMNVPYTAPTATDAVDGSVPVSCAPSSPFAVGTTTVTCSASDTSGNSASTQFTVTVTDTTAPTLSSVPSNISTAATGALTPVAFTAPTATDSVDGNVPVSCLPASPYPLGSTQVTCSAVDSHGNTASAPFTITVTDSVGPVLSHVPSNMSVQATGATTVATYAAPTATDNVDGPVAVTCTPPSGTAFPAGTITVNCSATDHAGNTTTQSFTITIADTLAPTLTVPGTISAEAASSAGASVSFAVTATDAVDPNPAVTCNPASGSTFHLGTTVVSCTARDAAQNQTSPQTFNVVVVDTTPPAFANVPGPITLEANSAAGSSASYASPTAVDSVDGPIASVSRAPLSGLTFPLGNTTVTCNAADAAGNVGTASFTVSVLDRTPPVLSAPAFFSLYATGPSGVPSNAPSVTALAARITAVDLVDPHPVITNTMPDVLPIGTTIVRFFATDASGNRVGANIEARVLAPPGGTPSPLPQPDALPPENVSGLTVKGGDSSVTLRWKLPPASDFDHVVLYRSAPSSADLGTAVYTGRATTYTDHGLKNGVEYRYVVVSYDKSGNRSVGIAILATPQIAMIVSPADGSSVKKPPVLIWRSYGGADYYNVQLFRVPSKGLNASDLSNATKVLSVWPNRTKLALKTKWKFAGRTYRLTRGTYRWFVWPGFGSPVEARYGPLLGQSTFTVTR